jgi:glycosyltransferase involved in cell wall biosynthesis
VENVLRSLTSQTYPAESTELLFIDNGSSDNTKEIIRKYPVKLFSEDSSTSPYAARNLGILNSSGRIIAFTDANKVPEEGWIEEGVAALLGPDADLAGGDIQFDTGENPGVAEVFDSFTFNNNRALVEKEKGSACGNLFVRRSVFEETGLFPGTIRSGMDIWWTQRAVQSGFTLVFAEKAVVHCIPRSLPDVIKKSYRVGVSHPINMKSRGLGVSAILWEIIKTLAPPRISPLRDKLKHSSHSVSLVKLWTIAWFSRLMLAFGRFYGLFFMRSQPSAEPFIAAGNDRAGDL